MSRRHTTIVVQTRQEIPCARLTSTEPLKNENPMLLLYYGCASHNLSPVSGRPSSNQIDHVDLLTRILNAASENDRKALYIRRGSCSLSCDETVEMKHRNWSEQGMLGCIRIITIFRVMQWGPASQNESRRAFETLHRMDIVARCP